MERDDSLSVRLATASSTFVTPSGTSANSLLVWTPIFLLLVSITGIDINMYPAADHRYLMTKSEKVR
jgi:hypothetical protein